MEKSFGDICRERIENSDRLAFWKLPRIILPFLCADPFIARMFLKLFSMTKFIPRLPPDKRINVEDFYSASVPIYVKIICWIFFAYACFIFLLPILIENIVRIICRACRIVSYFHQRLIFLWATLLFLLISIVIMTIFMYPIVPMLLIFIFPLIVLGFDIYWCWIKYSVWSVNERSRQVLLLCRMLLSNVYHNTRCVIILLLSYIDFPRFIFLSFLPEHIPKLLLRSHSKVIFPKPLERVFLLNQYFSSAYTGGLVLTFR